MRLTRPTAGRFRPFCAERYAVSAQTLEAVSFGSTSPLPILTDFTQVMWFWSVNSPRKAEATSSAIRGPRSWRRHSERRSRQA